MLYACVFVRGCMRVSLRPAPTHGVNSVWRGTSSWPVINARTSQDGVDMDQCCLTCLRGLMSSLAAVKLFGLISALIGWTFGMSNAELIPSTQELGEPSGSLMTQEQWCFQVWDKGAKLSFLYAECNMVILYVMYVSTLLVSLESWSSLSWTFTLESYTGSSIMDPIPRTAHPDRSESTLTCGG